MIRSVIIVYSCPATRHSLTEHQATSASSTAVTHLQLSDFSLIYSSRSTGQLSIRRLVLSRALKVHCPARTSMTMTHSCKRAVSEGVTMTGVVLLTAVLGGCCGFKCYQCSYSYDPGATSNNMDCIYSPARVADVHINYHCDKRCYTQEFYSLENSRVESIIRTCNWKNDSGYCIKDSLSITCYDSCAFDLCNDIQQPLHEIFPIKDSSGGTDGQTSDMSHCHGAGVTVMMTAMATAVLTTCLLV
ncbi:uncharacterized protein LOC112558113 [Pomacea canaliculata]|uniref:uncharacterized protein LOC112558113 n=1 Tax=Pomacea canaliculata TaxID=400727 RepID=UPI000D730A1E|nr:uncharacterized protein LOC112558113 [Pomacea canaliculata]